MSAVQDFPPVAAPVIRRSGGLDFSAVLRALVAGVNAAADYRRLCAMSDGRLQAIGIERADIPLTLHRRHFAGLGHARHLR